MLRIFQPLKGGVGQIRESVVKVLSESERTELKKALIETHELFFPVSSLVAGAIIGSVIRMQRLGANYKPSLSERTLSLGSEPYRCTTDFLRNFGTRHLVVEPWADTKASGLRVKLSTISDGTRTTELNE